MITAVSGVSVMWLDVQNETDQFAEISDGDTVVLTTGTSGSARILWKPPGTGQMWGIVRLPEASSPLHWGVATADWDGSNTITLTPCKGADDATETGEDDLDCTVVSPTDATPAAWISQGDILAYLPTGEGEGILLPVVTGLIPVSLAKDGGSDGDYDTTCSFTYTLTAMSESEPLDSGVSLQSQRIANSPYEEATVGLAAHSGESIDLIWCDEQPSCEDLDVVVGVQISGTDIQIQTHSVRVLAKKSVPNDWATIHSGTECPQP